MSNTGHTTACSSTAAVQSMISVSDLAGNVAMATALPATSWAQVTVAAGWISSCIEHSRSSRLSRGRSISR
jgi:hypothetical protein